MADLSAGIVALRKQEYPRAFEEIERAAKEGGAVAQVGLGYLYEHGYGVARSYAEAQAWYRKAALQGNPQAMEKMARMHALGLGVQDNMIVAVDWLRKAAEAGNQSALRGDTIAELRRGNVDRRQFDARAAGAQAYFARKAEQGDITAQLNLAYMYLAGFVAGRDPRAGAAQARALLQKAAEKGYAGACVLLAYLTETGAAADLKGPASDAPAQAAYWYQQAANKGNAYAQYSLAALYLGETVGGRAPPALRRDAARARDWATRAAEQGFLPAQTLLGTMLLDGQGVAAASQGGDAVPPEQREQAAGLAWLKKAATEADERALVRIGDAYLHGNGVALNPAEAVAWYARAVDAADSPLAYARLGRMYEQGLGVERNDARAFDFYVRAATPEAEPAVHASLARMYETGQGTAPDASKAFHEYALAAIAGDAASMQKLAEVFERGLLGQEVDLNKARIWKDRLARLR